MTTTLIVMNCIIFLIIIIFIGLFIYIFRDYFLYKNDTDSKINKTSNYINDVIKDIDTNIVHYNNLIDNKYDDITSQINSNIIDKINRNSKIINYNADIINSNISNTSNNIVNFDKNLNRYMTFNADGNINKKLYDYNFIGNDNLNSSLDILKNVNAKNGLNVNTDANNFKICNNTIPGIPCMSYKIDNNKLNIKNSSNDTIESYNLTDNNIFIGKPGNYSSPLVVDESNVYIKQLNLIKSDRKVVGIGTTSDIIDINRFINNFNIDNTNDLEIKKPLKICNGTNCIKVGIGSTTGVYNIEAVNSDKINMIKGNDILSSYDFTNKKIYLGGYDNNASMIIDNNDRITINKDIYLADNKKIYIGSQQQLPIQNTGSA